MIHDHNVRTTGLGEVRFSPTVRIYSRCPSGLGLCIYPDIIIKCCKYTQNLPIPIRKCIQISKP